MRVAAFIGHSGAGKTTAIEAMIRHFVAQGESVGALKHTHHPLNEDEERGDTGRFRRAGADPVILAGDGEAVVFSSRGIRRVTFTRPSDLLPELGTAIVFVEGFQSIEEFPRVLLSEHSRRSASELLAIVDRIWRP